MRYSKVAAVVAGSVMAVGVAAPAFASTTDSSSGASTQDAANTVDAQNMSTMPTSINGGVQQALNEQPLQKVADTAHADAALGTVTHTTDHLRDATATDGLVGQTAGTAKGVAGSGLAGAVPGASLLGGLPVGGLLGGLSG